MQETRRKRIVINLDPRAGSTARVGKGKGWATFLVVIAVLAIALLAVAVGGLFWWRHYQTTPTYSLALLIDAAQRNDTVSVDQYVDKDKIVVGLASGVTDKMRSRYGVPLNLIDPHRLDAAIAALLPQVKEHLREEIDKSIQQMASKTTRRPFFITALTLPYVAKVNINGDVASVTASDQIPALTLQRNGNRWKVVALKDDTLVTSTIDDFIRDLPAIGQPPGEEPLFHGTKPRRK